MNISDALNRLPNSKGAVVILSGGLDSTIAMRLAIEKYGKDNVAALTFNYGQKQAVEIEYAKRSTTYLRVKHKIIDASFLGDISQGFSANIDKNIPVPTIYQVLGDPAPKTEVPFRNMILFSIAASYAQVNNLDTIICGLQVHDCYGYWDTTESFIDKMNKVFSENRKIKISLIAPFVDVSKKDELLILNELDDNIDLASYTFTCYDPDKDGNACGKCGACSERIQNFIAAGFIDKIQYQTNIPWSDLCAQ